MAIDMDRTAASFDITRPCDKSAGTAGRGRSHKKSWIVYQQLKQRIIIGRLTYLADITEQSLAQEFNCSQGTIREALLSLKEDGLVERRGYQGTFVTHTSDQEAVLLARLRISLECDSLTSEALAKCTPDAMEPLWRMSETYEAAYARRDVYGASEADRALHMAIFSFNNMPGLQPVLSRCLLLLHRFALSCSADHFRRDRANSAGPHDPILSAMASGNLEATRALLFTHINAFLLSFVPDVHSRAQEAAAGAQAGS